MCVQLTSTLDVFIVDFRPGAVLGGNPPRYNWTF